MCSDAPCSDEKAAGASVSAALSRHGWTPDARRWPNRHASRMVEAGDQRWHVQTVGEGPSALLLHGAGASTHSWAPLTPYLAEEFQLTAIDLPGHGFTQNLRNRLPTLPYVAGAVAGLIKTLGIDPVLIVGHSAGAAVMLKLMATGAAPARAVSINGALKPFDGPAGHLFPLFAKMLMLNPFTSHFFAWRAQSRARVEALIGQTGSTAPPEQIDCYEQLLQRPQHVSGTLAMMANWDLTGLAADMRRMTAPVTFIAGEKDAAVPPSVSREAAAITPGARYTLLPGLGHLAHEEDPAQIAALIRAASGAGAPD